MAKALQDIKVLDFSHVFAGPYCTSLLAELGAEVVKVEKIGEGDRLRKIVPRTKQGEVPVFIARNRGKKSVTLNLGSARGQQIARDLAKLVDIVIENFSPGVMGKLGLGYEELLRLNPKLVCASISGYGHTGPRIHEPSFDNIAQAMGGFMALTGYPDGPPTRAGPAIADISSGLYATIAILAALHYSSMTGKGQIIDISLQDCVFAISSQELAGTYFMNNQLPRRQGNHHPINAPQGCFTAKDGYVTITASYETEWVAFLRVIGREDLLNDTEYASREKRARHKDEIIALTEEWTKARTVEEIVTAFRKANIPSSPVPSFDEVAHDPQILAREMIVEVEQPVSGKLRMPGSVFKMSETPGDSRIPAPSLGEHNYEIYSRWLGYSDAEIKKLVAEGII